MAFTRELPPPQVARPAREAGVVVGTVVDEGGALRFPVRPVAGPTVVYVLSGPQFPGALRHGDLVRVVGGRPRPDGTIPATSVEVLATLNGPVVRHLLGFRP
jgi:hypothetical protein